MMTWSVCLKKWNHFKIILKNLLQKNNEAYTSWLFIFFIQILHLMQQNLILIVTEAKIVGKSFVEI